MQELASQLGLRIVSTEALRGPRPSFRKQGCSIASTSGQGSAEQVAPGDLFLHKPVCPSQLALTPSSLRMSHSSQTGRGATQKEVGGSVAVLPKGDQVFIGERP